MITISRQTDYACRIILHLSMLPPGERVTAQEVAKRRIIPRAMIRRIVTLLGAAKLLTTTRGSGGGLALARPSGEISLLDVVQAMEGPVALNACTTNPAACPLMSVCSVHEIWVKAQTCLLQELAEATFDKLSKRGKALANL